MTQPKTGHRDWVYVDVPSPAENVTTTTANATLGAADNSSSMEASEVVEDQDDLQVEAVERSCRDGSKLQESWVCDGIPDCPDHSDEDNCECERGAGDLECGGGVPLTSDLHLGSGVCAHGAFRCPSGRACPSGDCEAPLSPCLPRQLLCDGVPHCSNEEDEAACVGVARNAPAQELGSGDTVTCSGGLRIPSAWRCDGRKDCPLDGLDEMGCVYCGPSEFICPTSGVCVPQEQVCDGSPSLPSCTDEQYCDACPPGHLVCDVCVDSWQICDGVWDCEAGEDERECVGVGVGVDGVETCAHGLYRCPSGHCIPELSVCDRRIDCPDGDDERHCLDDNFEVLRYISVKPSAVSGKLGKRSDPPSRLVTPTLHHPTSGVGVLTFKYRLDAWIGASNGTLSLEMVDADDPSVGVRPWAVWRQSGHKGRQWLSATVLIPPLPSLDKYKLSFLVSHDDHAHESQQLHLSQLAFTVVHPRALNHLGQELLECEFEDSLCGWSQLSTEGGYSWVFARASPHARRTGPITGYPDVVGSGFIFADSLHGTEGSIADLLSPPLLLPEGPDPALCFRFAVFLFGADVAKVSVHVLQMLGDATHTAEIFHAVGGKGLSWMPVGVTVGREDVAEVGAPLVLAVRATRGPGTEADIALDHVAVLSGACHLQPVLDANVTLNATLSHADASALSAGAAVTPLAPPSQIQDQSEPSAPAHDPCGTLTACMACVAQETEEGLEGELGWCTWCDLTQACVSRKNPAAAACPDHLTVHHNTTKSQQRRGPGWCPQLAARQERQVLVSAGSSPVLSFPVHNIQPSQTDSGWICVFEPVEEDAGESQETGTEETKGESVEEEKKEKQKREEVEDEEEIKEAKEKRIKTEEEFDFKKKKAEMKRMKKGWKLTREGSLRLPGQFQGRVFDMGGGVGTGVSVSTGVGVGAIRCGDGLTELRPAPARPYAHYTVKILTPAGALLDNPGDVRLVVYGCDLLGSSCPSCVAVNATLSCGWCLATRTCTTHAHCIGTSWFGPGRTCDSEEYLKSLAEPLGEPQMGLGEPMEPLEDEMDHKSHKNDLSFDNMDNFLESSDQAHDVEILGVRDDEDEEEGEDEDMATVVERRTGKEGRRHGRKKGPKIKKPEGGPGTIADDATVVTALEHNDNSVIDSSVKKTGHLGGKKKAGKRTVKGKMKVTNRGRSFLRLPQHPGLFVARDAWRLHTGRQYYIPVNKKTLINLGFVRQVTYGSLAEEKTRTVLINGAWKKAAGYFVDLFEKVDQDPVTSIITTSRGVFEQLLAQLIPEQ